MARVRDTGRFKQFRKGIAQLDEEGVVQVLRDPDLGDQAPVLAAVGPMQFEVARAPPRERVRRPGRAEPHHATRWPAAPTRPAPPALRAMRGVDVLGRADGTLLALFESPYWLDRLVADQPELTLEPLVAGDQAG